MRVKLRELQMTPHSPKCTRALTFQVCVLCFLCSKPSKGTGEPYSRTQCLWKLFSGEPEGRKVLPGLGDAYEKHWAE
jgi:hypothetical protein